MKWSLLIFLFMFVSLFLFMPDHKAYAVNEEYTEITIVEYEHVIKMLNEVPELVGSIRNSFKDDKITQKEYKEIHVLYISFYKDKVKQRLKEKLTNLAFNN